MPDLHPEPQPASAQPAYGQPSSAQPAYGQPASAQPAYGQPTTGQPAYGQPAYGQPQIPTQPSTAWPSTLLRTSIQA